MVETMGKQGLMVSEPNYNTIFTLSPHFIHFVSFLLSFPLISLLLFILLSAWLFFSSICIHLIFLQHWLQCLASFFFFLSQSQTDLHNSVYSQTNYSIQNWTPGLSPSVFTNCVFLCLRPPASNILWTSLLVLYFILRAEPASRRDLPRLAALADSGWLHRPLQLWAFLPWIVVQRQPQRSCGVNTQTHRWGSVLHSD